MNDRQSLEQLDQRGAAAAVDARACAASRPRPAFDPAAARTMPAPARLSVHCRSRRPFVAVAAAAAVVVAGIAVGVVQHRTNDDDNRPAGVTTVQPRPFLATDLPNGLALVGASGADSSGGSMGPMLVYGSAPDDPALGVIVVNEDPKAFADWPRVTVDGRTVITDDSGGFGKNVVVVVRGDRTLILSSPTLSLSSVAKLAERVTIEGSRPVVPESALPDGVRLLGEDADPMADSGAISVSRGGFSEGFLTAYQRGTGPGGATVTVTSTSGDEVRLNATRLLANQSKITSVRGHQGLFTNQKLTAGAGLEVQTLSWLERPEEVLRVSGYGATEAELRTVAEGLQPVPADEWRKLLERTKLGELSPSSDTPPVTKLGRGRFADGTAWALLRHDDKGSGGLDLKVALDGDSDTSEAHSGSAQATGTPGGEPAGVFTENLVQLRGDRHFAAGMLRSDVATVVLLDGQGRSSGKAAVLTGNGAPAWVAELTTDPTVVVARAADGRELDRVTLSNFGENQSPEISEEATATTMPNGTADGSGSNAGSDPAPGQPAAPAPVLPGD